MLLLKMSQYAGRIAPLYLVNVLATCACGDTLIVFDRSTF
jgi:hypothetical protein